jgi:hypothetical protein
VHTVLDPALAAGAGLTTFWFGLLISLIFLAAAAIVVISGQKAKKG